MLTISQMPLARKLFNKDTAELQGYKISTIEINTMHLYNLLK